jgi:hypothetical protein
MELTNGDLPAAGEIDPGVAGVVGAGRDVGTAEDVVGVAGAGEVGVALATTELWCQVYTAHRQVPITSSPATAAMIAVVFAT